MKKRGFILILLVLFILSLNFVSPQKIYVEHRNMGSGSIITGFISDPIDTKISKIEIFAHDEGKGQSVQIFDANSGSFLGATTPFNSGIYDTRIIEFSSPTYVSSLRLTNPGDFHLDQKKGISVVISCSCSNGDICCSNSCDWDPAGTEDGNECCSGGREPYPKISCKQQGEFVGLNYYTQSQTQVCRINGWSCTGGSTITCSKQNICGEFGGKTCYFYNGISNFNFPTSGESFSGNWNDPQCSDRIDNDCDGDIDRADSDCRDCEEGDTQSCSNTRGVCGSIQRQCVNGRYESCDYNTITTYSETELCIDGLDNNCREGKDEGCNCNTGDKKPCGSNEGVCTIGEQTCRNGIWSNCEGGVVGSEEICDGLDNNCDGTTDEGYKLGGSCSVGFGICQNEGFFECKGPETVGCSANLGVSLTEICDNIDNNCNGAIDEGCQLVQTEAVQPDSIQPRTTQQKSMILEEVKEVLGQIKEEDQEQQEGIEILLEEIKEEQIEGEEKGIRQKASDLFSGLLGEIRSTTITETPEVEALCGNGIIDSGETCNNCRDAVCSIDQYCDNGGQCVTRSNLSSFFRWLVITLILVPSLVYLYYHVKKRKISKQDIGIFIVALLFIIFSLVILYLNISTISFSLISGVDHSATIIIESDINNRLYELYQQSGDVEFVVCIKGNYNNGRYQIYDIEEIPTVSKSVAAIEAQSCSKLNHLGTIHSHPGGVCEPSKQDIYTFGQKNDILMGVICEKDTYGFYTKKNFDMSMFYIIKDVEVKEEFKKGSSPISLVIILLSLVSAYLIIRFRDKILDTLKLFKVKKYPNLLITMNLMNKTEKIMINRLIKTDGLLKQDLMNKLGLSKSSFNDALLRLQRSNLIVIKKEEDGERVYLSARAKN